MTKILTPENKKQEILEYINQNSDTNDPFKISRKYLISNFKDENYNEEKIDELIDESIDNDQITEKSDINIEIIYPKSKEKEIKSKWKDFILPYKTITILLLLYITTVVATYYTKRGSFEDAIVIPVILLLGYGIFTFTFNFIIKKIPIFKKFNYRLIFCYVLSLAIIGSLAYIFSYYKKESFTTGYFLTVLVGGCTVGTLIYKFILNKEP